MNSYLPWLAAVAFVLYSVAVLYVADSLRKYLWLFPVALLFTFAAFSLYAVLTEGIFGFWAEHTRNTWGNQIWFDLLLAVGIGWGLAMPRARALGMRPLPWLLFIICTGSIGFLAMLARILYLENQSRTKST